jgi:hypothetical protein
MGEWKNRRIIIPVSREEYAEIEREKNRCAGRLLMSDYARALLFEARAARRVDANAAHLAQSRLSAPPPGPRLVIPRNVHLTLTGMLDELPAPGNTWTPEGRENWLAAVSALVRLIYRDRDVSEAEDAKRLSPEGVAARAEEGGIANPTSGSNPIGGEAGDGG